jgi:hypothetical protein
MSVGISGLFKKNSMPVSVSSPPKILSQEEKIQKIIQLCDKYKWKTELACSHYGVHEATFFRHKRKLKQRKN